MINQKFFFEQIPSVIIILIPAFLISGPFLSDLGVSIVALLFLINSAKNNLFQYYNNVYFKVFLIFWGILVVSSFLSENILNSLKTSFFYFRFGIFSICFWYLIDKNKKILDYIFYSIAICFACLILDGYIQFFNGKNIFGIELSDGYRISSFFGSELILGSYLCRLFPILFGLFIIIDKKNKIKNINLILLSIIFILSKGLILVSGERAALFFMNLSAIYIILTIKDYKVYRLWTYIGSLILIVCILVFYPNAKTRIIDKTISNFTNEKVETSSLDNLNKNFNSKKIYIFSKAHTDMYYTGLKMFYDNKFFGVGPRQFRNACKDYPISEFSCQSHPHNTYIELLSEVGFFGFLIIFGIFLLIVVFSFMHFIFSLLGSKKFNFSDFELCLLSAFLISLWPFIPTGSFFHNWMSIVYYYPVGMFLWHRSFNAKLTKKSLK